MVAMVAGTVFAPQANGEPATNGNGDARLTPSITPKNEALHIVIVGAGIGGLSAASFLRQQGHRITVLEQSRFANEVGAAVHLAPNCNGLLRRMGLYAEDFGANKMQYITDYKSDGTLLKHVPLDEPNKMWQHPWHLIHRVRLHEELKKMVTSPEGKGTPVELRTSSRVADIDPFSATATLESGENIQGDIVIGADGVHSRARSRIPGGDMKAFASGKSAFRFLVPRKAALEDPKTAKFAERHGELIIWYAADRRVVMYPCANNELLNFVCIHPGELSEVKSEDWNQGGNLQNMLDVYGEFDPAVQSLIGKADPDSLKVWELLDMENIPTWVNDRLALLGDAAHPFTPHQGQGAGVAIEDAASLAVVLPLGTKVEEIPERLRLYESIRYERAHKIQDFSRIMGRDIKPDEKKLNMMEFTNYNFGHDEWDNSTQAFRKHQWAKNSNLYWRTPISFGPMPGPRQTFEGKPRTATHSTFCTASIKFKTSATLLKNLFPTQNFRFASPGTVAYASFSQTTLNKMEWLGGSGYHHLGLYIHGVQYTKKNGDILNGTFMPILFESLADPIVSGREELGMPKLYCALDVFKRSNQYRLGASWQGASFGSFTWEGLEEVDPSEDKGTIGGSDDDGILAYRYIPAVGDRGKADSEHVVFVPHAEESKVVPSKVKIVKKAKKATVKLDGLDWEALPTLHHVASRLAEIPIYEVVGAKVVEGEGVPDVSTARRID